MIRLLVLDVDGTLTDGGIYYDSTGNTHSLFSAAKFIAPFQSGCSSGLICFIVIIEEILILTCSRRFFLLR